MPSIQAQHHTHIHKASSLRSPVPETPPGSPPLDPTPETSFGHVEIIKSTCSSPGTNDSDINSKNNTTTIHVITSSTTPIVEHQQEHSNSYINNSNGSIDNEKTFSGLSLELSSICSSVSSVSSVGLQSEIISLNHTLPHSTTISDSTLETFQTSSPNTHTVSTVSAAVLSSHGVPLKNSLLESYFSITPPVSVNDNVNNTETIKQNSDGSQNIVPAETNLSPPIVTGTNSSSPLYPSDHPLYASQSIADIVTSNESVLSISAKTLTLAINHHYSSPLPEIDNIFPWLHGLHPGNMCQRMFFHPARKANPDFFNSVDFANLEDTDETFQMPKSARGFLMVKVDNPNSQGTLIGSIYPNEILVRKHADQDFDTCDFSFNDSMNSSLETFDLSAESYSSNTDSSTNDILNPSNYTASFINADSTNDVSIRNFHSQVAKWAFISDIVFYVSEERLRPAMHEFARLVSRAQANVRHENPGLPLYRTFVVEDPIEKFLDESHHIMSIPPRGTPYNEEQITMRNWDSNFLVHENVELLMMSSTSAIDSDVDSTGRVWLGNVSDYEAHLESVWDYIWNSGKTNQQDPTNNGLPSTDVSEPNNDVGMSDDELDSLSHQALKTNWTLYICCKSGVPMPSLFLIDDEIRKTMAGDLENVFSPTGSIDSGDFSANMSSWYKTIIEFPSSGTITAATLTENDVCSIISMCKLLYIRGRGTHKGRPTSSLIFCTDGYTESSVLALCYAIYSQGLTAPEAWIYIHKHCCRPIFSFPMDPQLVLTLEKALLRYSPAVAGSLYEESHGAVFKIHNTEGTDIGSNSKNENVQKEVIFKENCDPKPITPDQLAAEDQWFASFDGSFPSLILHHMYLGSLVHANNVQMLTRLGIKRIISVGEPLEWVDYSDEDEYMDEIDELGDHEEKRIQIVDKPYPGISKVMYIRGIKDDGIDSLTEYLWACLDFLEEGEQANEPTLVHCRVGVSRSATVCIAEVMKRLSVGLPHAYLFVRVRRLNVVIQPHLRFMFELTKWEERHRQTGKGWLREVDWPIFCREISIMNRVYTRS